MDEAERCHEIAYIAYGKLIARGTVGEVIGRSGLATWSVEGEGLGEVAEKLRAARGVDMVAAFGTALHVSAMDAAALERAIAPFRADPRWRWERSAPSLEDVFIQLMAKSQSEQP
jgi:ABC-2 type transport system ATP-binding protein